VIYTCGAIRSPGTSFVFSSAYLPLPSLQIEFVRCFKATGIPMGYAPGCAVSFSGNSGCTYEFTRTYLYELERISGRRFFVQDNRSDVQQFAREGCATLRKYAKLS